MNILLSLSAAMIVGLLMTRVAKWVKLPNVTGYLVAGLIVGPYVLKLVSEQGLADLEVITTIALGFIAFSIGGEFKWSHLKKIGSKCITITLFQALCAVALVDAVLLLAGFDAPLALTLGAIAAATAPAATLLVVRQYKAKGPVTDTLLPVVAMDDAVGLMAFSLSVAVAQSLASGAALGVYSTVVQPLLEILLSLGGGRSTGRCGGPGHALFQIPGQPPLHLYRRGADRGGPLRPVGALVAAGLHGRGRCVCQPKRRVGRCDGGL